MQISISSESNTRNTWFAGKGIQCGCPRSKQSCARTSIHIITLVCPVRIIFHIGCVPQIGANGGFREYHIESLLGSPMPFLVH